MSNPNRMNIKSGIEKKSLLIGWLTGMAFFAIVLAVYISSIKLTQSRNDHLFQYRAWTWMEYLLGICSLAAISLRFKQIKPRMVVCGLIFAFVCWISFFSRTGEASTTIIDGLVTFLAYIAGCTLITNENGIKSSANEGNIKAIAKSLLWGIIISIPFACINVAYFRITQGPLKLQNPFTAGFLALQPGIGEEIVFRFFIINAVSAILRNKLSQKPLLFVVIFLGVVPHSILHFPDLWLNSLPNAGFMLLSTSLLFGLPMAYIQCRKNLEAAIGFHWFIDFLRFLAGF